MEDYIDFEAIEDEQITKYVEWCKDNKVKPRMSDFSIWKDDQDVFDRERNMDTARDAELDSLAELAEQDDEVEYPDVY